MDASTLYSDEGRGQLKASVSARQRYQPKISEWGNPMGVMSHDPHPAGF